MLLETANTYLALNLYPEALAAYREADKLLEHSRMRFEQAKGLWVRGSALISCSRFDEAETALDEAAASLAALDNLPLLSSVMLEQASLADARGDRAVALMTARVALDLASGGDWPAANLRRARSRRNTAPSTR